MPKSEAYRQGLYSSPVSGPCTAGCTDTNKQTVELLRSAGYCVVVFTPAELAGASPDKVADRLVELGWDVIDCLG